jgi:Putative beta-barrel porin-2, OmpL-like. bbp2/Carboxypeptidase regulatory-like domain
MTRNLLVSAVVPACIAFQIAALSTPASGQGLFGGVGGVTRDSASKQPLAFVRITAHNVDKGTDRTATSGLDGTFIMPGLEPGLYDMAAARDGFAKSIAHVEVAAPGTHRVDFLLAADYPPAREAKTAPAVVDATLTAVEDELAALKKRIGELEVALQARAALAPPAVGAATPADSPKAASAPAAPTPVPVPTPAPAAPVIPEALQAPGATTGVDNFTPFAFADFTWLNGTPRNKDTVLDTKFFTPEIRFDTHFITSFNQPIDHSMGGATESFRSGEFQVEQISVGGDFHWNNVRGRILTMNGLFATTTPRNDASTAVGQWDTGNAYRYVSEAWGGYHFNVNHGLNVDAGIFVSYIGLFSYYNFDNWTYQPSFVSSNTPWFFNGLRIQWFPTNKLKIEPWIINGWQSYNRMNGHHGFGGQILYRPKEWLSMVFNNYGNGTDTLGVPNRVRIHTDDSIEVRYFNKPDNTGLSKMAFSVTADAGCEYGKLGGTSCTGKGGQPKQAFLGWMAYNRMWFHKDLVALTLGGGKMNNPGRYLTLLPPINGAFASSGSPYFTQNPGDKAHMWDTTLNLQYMPKQYITWWFEGGYRHSDVPYWSGRGGITPPGGNNGSPSQFACMSGAPSGTNDLPTAYANCGGPGSVWFPDLRHGQASISAGVMVKF